MRNLFKKRGNVSATLFVGHFVDVKAMYFLEFGRIPCICFVGELDVTGAFAHVEKTLRRDIVAIYQHSFLNNEKGELFFNNTVFVLKGRRMIELADNYCQVLHTIHQYKWAHQFILDLGTSFRVVPPEVKTRVIGFVRSGDMN